MKPIPSTITPWVEALGTERTTKLADPTEAEGEGQADDQSPKGLRAKLESTLSENSDLKGSVVDLSQKLAFYDAELGHLTEQQRDDVLTLAKTKGQTTAEDLKAIAERLSYTKVAPAPTETAPVQAAAPDLSQMEQFGTGGSTGEPPLGARQAFEKELAEFSGSAAEYDEFLRRNMEFLT